MGSEDRGSVRKLKFTFTKGTTVVLTPHHETMLTSNGNSNPRHG
jgi:hypothetical protein